jgi:hypothetical protein
MRWKVWFILKIIESMFQQIVLNVFKARSVRIKSRYGYIIALFLIPFWLVLVSMRSAPHGAPQCVCMFRLVQQRIYLQVCAGHDKISTRAEYRIYACFDRFIKHYYKYVRLFILTRLSRSSFRASVNLKFLCGIYRSHSKDNCPCFSIYNIVYFT